MKYYKWFWVVNQRHLGGFVYKMFICFFVVDVIY